MSLRRNAGEDKGFLMKALPTSISRKGYIQKKNNLPNKAPVKVKGNTQGLEEEGNDGESWPLHDTLHSPIFQIMSHTVNWGVVAWHFPPLTPLLSMRMFFSQLLLTLPRGWGWGGRHRFLLKARAWAFCLWLPWLLPFSPFLWYISQPLVYIILSQDDVPIQKEKKCYIAK